MNGNYDKCCEVNKIENILWWFVQHFNLNYNQILIIEWKEHVKPGNKLISLLII